MTLPAERPHPQGAVPSGAAAGDDFTAVVRRVADRFGANSLTFTTADLAMFVGRQPGRDSNRQHSAAVLEALCTLEALGHVSRLRDGPPILWYLV